MVDTNEVHAYLRGCQDAEFLQELEELMQERVELMLTNLPGTEPEKPYLHPSTHGHGLHQMPMAGPDPVPSAGANMAAQAAVNDAILQRQVEEGRTPRTLMGPAVVDAPADEVTAAAEEEASPRTRKKSPAAPTTTPAPKKS